MRGVRIILALLWCMLGAEAVAQPFSLLPSAEYFCRDPNCTVENLCGNNNACKEQFKKTPPSCPCRTYDQSDIIAGEDETDWSPQDPVGVLSGFDSGLCSFLGSMAPWCDIILQCIKDRDNCAFNCFDVLQPGVQFTASEMNFCRQLCAALPNTTLCPALVCIEQYRTTGQVGNACCPLADWIPDKDVAEGIKQSCYGAIGCRNAYQANPTGQWWLQGNGDCMSILEHAGPLVGIPEDLAQAMAASVTNITDCVGGLMASDSFATNIRRTGRGCCSAMVNVANTAEAFADSINSTWGGLPDDTLKNAYKTCKGFTTALYCGGLIKENIQAKKKARSEGTELRMIDRNQLPQYCCNALDIGHAAGMDKKMLRAAKNVCRFGKKAGKCAFKLFTKNNPDLGNGECCDLVYSDLRHIDNLFGTQAQEQKMLRFAGAACNQATGIYGCIQDGMQLKNDLRGGVINTMRRGVKNSFCCKDITDDDLVSELLNEYADPEQNAKAQQTLASIQDSCHFSYDPTTLLTSFGPVLAPMLTNVANDLSANGEINLETFVPTESFCAGVVGGGDYIPDSTLSGDQKHAARELCNAAEEVQGAYMEYKRDPSGWQPTQKHCKLISQTVNASQATGNFTEGARSRYDPEVMQLMNHTCTVGKNEVECIKHFEMAQNTGSAEAPTGEILTSAMAAFSSPQCENAISALSRPGSVNSALGDSGLQVLGQAFTGIQMILNSDNNGGSPISDLQGAASIFEIVASGLMSSDTSSSGSGIFTDTVNPIVEHINDGQGLPPAVESLGNILGTPLEDALGDNMTIDALTGGMVADMDALLDLNPEDFGDIFDAGMGIGSEDNSDSMLNLFGTTDMLEVLQNMTGENDLGEAYDFMGTTDLETFLSTPSSSGGTIMDLLSSSETLTEHDQPPFGGVWGEAISSFMDTTPATMQLALEAGVKSNEAVSPIKEYQPEYEGQHELVIDASGVISMDPSMDVCPALQNALLPAGGVSVEGFLAAKKICEAPIDFLGCYHTNNFSDECCRVLQSGLNLPEMVNVGNAVPTGSLIYPLTNNGTVSVVNFTELYEYGRAVCKAGRTLGECVTNYQNFGGAWTPTEQCCATITSASSNQLGALGLSTQETYIDDEGFTQNTAYGALLQVCSAVDNAGACEANPTVACCVDLYENDLDQQLSPGLKQQCKHMLQCDLADEVTPSCCGFFRYRKSNLEAYCSRPLCLPGHVRDPYTCSFCIDPADVSPDSFGQQQFIDESEEFCG